MAAGAGFGAPRSLMARAIAALARREHSRTELARKLARYLEPPDDRATLERVLDELESRQLLSDERYAGAAVRTRSARYGDARLRRELTAKGVAAELATAAVQAQAGGELERARALWQRRFGTLPESLPERARQTRFLLTRGFSADTIRRVLGRRGAPAGEFTGEPSDD
jgi:regulatory protein